MKILNVLLVFLAFLAISCNNPNPVYDTDISTFNNSGISQAINITNQWRTTSPSVTTYVTPNEINVTFPDGRNYTKSIKDTLFYVAVAPYITYTHSCTNHYISSCKAELTNKTFSLQILDSNNETYFLGNVNSMDNGFFEFWLPREKVFEFKIGYSGKTCSQYIQTKGNSPTCITTAKLL